MLTTLISILIIYCTIQYMRNERTYVLRQVWSINAAPRYYEYTYWQIFKPSRRNWYGLKFPREDDFTIHE